MKPAAYKKNIFFLVLLSVLILSTPCMSEQVSQKTIMNLSLEQGKLMLLQNNLDIAIRQISPQIKKEGIKREEGLFDPVLSGSLQREDSSTPLSTRSSVAAGGRTSTDSEVYSVSTGLSGIFPAGTEYSIEFNDVRTENTFNSFNAEHDSFAGININQPLLKGSGSSVTQFNIIIAKKDRDISVSDFRQNVIDTLSDFKKAYWDLVLAIEDTKVKKESMKLAESLLDLNLKRLKAEVTSPLEVTKAEAGVASRKEALITARGVVREKENGLKKLISDDVYSMKNTEILPLSRPVINPFTFDLDRSFKDGIENRPDYEKLKTAISKNEVRVMYAKNQSFPEIDLEASYGLNGLGNSFSDSLNEMDGNNNWSIGIVAKFPLGNSTAKGNLRIAQLEARQELLNLKKLEQEILVEIDNTLRQAETNMQRIEAAGVSKRLAEKTLQAEEIKLKEGLSTSHDVLEFQEELVEARSREISAIIDYNKSLVELSRVKGTLLKEEDIMISYDKITVVGR